MRFGQSITATFLVVVVVVGLSFCQAISETNDGIEQQQQEEQQEQQQHRRLLYERLWMYQPRSKVTDIAAIDLDVKSIRQELSLKKMDVAQKIYQDGGHSGSTAVLLLDNALERDFPAGTTVVIPSGPNDEQTYGTLAFDVERQENDVMVTYTTRVTQDDHVGCQVGALPDPKLSGCFVESGTLNFPEFGKSYDYEYNQLTGNVNLRTMLTLALDAKKYESEPMFSLYAQYYGTNQYMDEITTAAFNSRKTLLPSSPGNMDFSIFQDTGNQEVVQISLVAMTTWMTVIGSMTDAIEQCRKGVCENSETCMERPGVYEWDSAVAYYTGSLVDFATNKGEMIFNMADTFCEEFRTCGTTGKSVRGNSYVNHQIFHHFATGQRDLLERYCEGAEQAKHRIVELMKVPLIQGAMRYAHMIHGEMESGDIEKHDGEAAAYALAVLPLVDACNPVDAQIIYDNLKPKRTVDVDFSAVKIALEKNYHCMKVQCHQVGGVFDEITGTYKEDAYPCNDLTSGLNDKQRKWAVALGVSFAGLFVFGIIACLVGKTENAMPERASNDLTLEPNENAEIS